MLGRTPFDTVMILLPIWLPALVIGLSLQWLVIRGAVLSALRRHAADSARPAPAPDIAP